MVERRPGRLVAALMFALVAASCASTPEYEQLPGDELFEWAQRQYEEEDWDDAVDGFERLLSVFPNHSRRAEARFLLARSFLEREEELTAIAEFERFLQRFPTHALAPRASFGICEAYASLSPIPQRDQRYTERAREACARTALDFPAHEVAEEAEQIRRRMVEKLAESEYLVGEFYRSRNLHDSAIMSYERVVDRYAQTEWAPKAMLGMYRAYRAIGWDEEAEQTREELVSLFPDSEAAQEVESERSNGDAR